MSRRKQPPKARMGRPPLPDGAAKSVFAIRLSDSERDAVKQAAKQAGKPMSQWAREVLLQATRSR